MLKKIPIGFRIIRILREILRSHIKRFEKDIAVCLTDKPSESNGGVTHAYFPALMACIGVLDLLSGLYKGKLDSPGLPELKAYAKSFLPNDYTNLILAVLYHCFRHKVAHIAHPYDVFDTDSKPKDFSGEPRRRISWIVTEEDCPVAITLEELPKTVPVKRAPKSWNIVYDHRVRVSIPKLKRDIIDSALKPSGYSNMLKADAASRLNFERCMNEYFWTK